MLLCATRWLVRSVLRRNLCSGSVERLEGSNMLLAAPPRTLLQYVIDDSFSVCWLNAPHWVECCSIFMYKCVLLPPGMTA